MLRKVGERVVTKEEMTMNSICTFCVKKITCCYALMLFVAVRVANKLLSLLRDYVLESRGSFHDAPLDCPVNEISQLQH